MRYICKKEYKDEHDNVILKQGDVVYASVTPVISLIRYSDKKSIHNVSLHALCRNFVQYDSLSEDPDLRDALYALLCKEEYVGPNYNEENFINELKELICATEDIQQEQSSIETLHTINQ